MSRKLPLNKHTLLPLVAVIVVVALSTWLLTDEPLAKAELADKVAPETPVSQSSESDTLGNTAVVTDEARPISYRTPKHLGEEPFASSLAGTQIDGSLQADSSGNLVVNLETRDFFDYFLNTVGEVSPERALAEIETLARENLPPQAAKQALALLDQYLNYKESALALGSQNLDPSRQHDPRYQLEMLKGALADLKQLRRNSFDASTHEAFFGLEEAYGEYTLATLDLQQRTDLSESAKTTLQEWHRQQLPEVIRRTESRMMAEGEHYRERQEVLASAQSPEAAGRQLQALGLEPERTAEVVNYLEERQQFDQRFEQYRQERASLEESGIAAEDLVTMEKRLLEQHFDDEQSRTWARLRTLDDQSP
ncbi:lipase secretion chaperone [Marinobacter sp. TBZ242]|uniref:Lipase chaperone n=1 Tax=Marinobacter azerbaijanicus TaxID=3050455 RepID=A0ABT7IBQ8_9GAMM|nr:lipase secretion chaperone [Marinobacter sp. TBZ242]MDL0431130.1 lipase secretion chaperone [Marinobacter sp. TBZ242]